MAEDDDIAHAREYDEDLPTGRSAGTIWALRALGLIVAAIIHIALGGKRICRPTPAPSPPSWR